MHSAFSHKACTLVKEKRLQGCLQRVEACSAPGHPPGHSTKTLRSAHVCVHGSLLQRSHVADALQKGYVLRRELPPLRAGGLGHLMEAAKSPYKSLRCI